MVSKRKFKRDYIILEAKDMNFRSKERVLPKAFAKIELNDEKSISSKNYETAINKLAELGRIIGGLLKANPNIRKGN